ncbi:hypothetical protein P154DRAFT_564763 [Amniculicola lignicola CBS 123094]|uniref:Anaphase-promoting complex subunit 4 n=1 Tax=Amniculicola lignicola CBS 123094 TaxID=1392246 RepID=A0A6A5WC62_9PLEO|nr:hypothetical protein P154DRAFT_564763 [Amniculicola lignicola CBS 123094]
MKAPAIDHVLSRIALLPKIASSRGRATNLRLLLSPPAQNKTTHAVTSPAHSLVAMEEPPGNKLLQQAEKTMLRPIHPHLIAYCPTMDLIAVVTDEENLDVYRINGQRAFGLKRKSKAVSVDAICWEFNGQAIAVAWSDGFTDIVSAETGKIIHKDLPPPSLRDRVEGKESAVRISVIGWGLNFIDVEAVKKRTGVRGLDDSDRAEDGSKGKGEKEEEGPKLSLNDMTSENWDGLKDTTILEDFLQRQPDLQNLEATPNIPDQMTMQDMGAHLPKLPLIPLPPVTPFMRAQPDSGAFGSQAQVDAILHSQHMKDHNSVEMLIRCTDDGTVHPSIYDSLETVNIRLPKEWDVKSSKVVLHTSHPYSCSHGLLMKIETREQGTKLAFVPLTLDFIPLAGLYLHLIASTAAQLQNLLGYVQHSMQRIRTFWKHSQDLPRKFMMNISETLEEKGHGDLGENLYQVACSGHCPPLIKEWLVDELQEAGHKRWDNTVTTSTATLLALIHENLLPAIDRCAVAIARLRILSKFKESSWIFTGPLTNFDDLLTLLYNFRSLASAVLSYVNDEKRQFASFSKWLRYQIDFEATEPGSQSREEMEVRDPGVDINVVLQYIQYPLLKSDLAAYLNPESELDSEQKNEQASSYESTRHAIKLLKEGASYKAEALCMDHVLRQFGESCTKIFQQVSHWQESNTSMKYGVILEDADVGETKDMRMVYGPYNPLHLNSASTYTAVIPKQSPDASTTLRIHRLTHTPTITSFPKDLLEYASTVLVFPQGAEIHDVKFADDRALLVLISMLIKKDDADEKETRAFRILSLPYNNSVFDPPSDSPPNISFTDLPSSTHPSYLLPGGRSPPFPSRKVLSLTSTTLQQYTKHTFESRFEPLKLVTNGRKDVRVILVLGKDRKHYKIFDMEHNGKERDVAPNAEVGEEDWETDESGGVALTDLDDDIKMGGV